MASSQLPGIRAAAILYERGFARSEIRARLQDPAIMKAMFEPRAYTEAEANAAYDAVALDTPMADADLA
ncbi:MAG TPA: hypothetical protein VEZ15_00415 [Acidimicrobiia bacterium]|nr:hypothetical protein [Acidimicrobiia bacterium]